METGVARIIATKSIPELLTINNQTPKNIDSISQEILNDTIQGLKIIDEISKGMIEFVNRLRSSTLIPSPQLKNIELDAIVNNIQVLLSDELVWPPINRTFL